MVTLAGGASAWFYLRGEDGGPPKVPVQPVKVAVNPPTPLPTLPPAPTPTPHPSAPTSAPHPTPAQPPTFVATPTPTHPAPAPPRHERRPTAAAGSTARLSVSSEPPTEAFLDGSDLGPTPLTDVSVPAGKHTLRLANANLAISHVAHLSLSPGQAHREDIRLRKGKVFFFITPWANVTFAGQLLGQSPLDPRAFYEGTYDVVLENPQLRKTIRRKVTVEAGKPTFLKVDLTQG